ncbi:MAG: ferritin-like domain-containing protein [Actinomycetota bacterium]|nr:ferritin-like domain-containing protein [Actinomycetota bacterium]
MTPRIVIADGDADTAQVAAFERDRRELLRRGFALGGAAIAASSVPLLLSVRNAFAQASGDAAILEQAINLEQIAVLAYDTALAGALLSPAVRRSVRRFRGHEQQHGEALTTALTDLGGIAPAPPKGLADVDEVVEGLRDVRTQAEMASFAIELETAAIAAYYDAQPRFVEARLLQMGASIMANEGQHLVVLRTLAGRDPVPFAFETGTT